MNRSSPAIGLLTTALLISCLPEVAQGTWSIVLANQRTGEVGVAAATCVERFDPAAEMPVVVVGRGAANVQAAGDRSGTRRALIFEQLGDGLPPAEMIENLEALPGTHQGRQYGIVDTTGRSASFTGQLTRDWTGGLTGRVGNVAYAVQGNLLAGSCVVDSIENALHAEERDLPGALMAAMIAAREAGGDGRCSCDINDPAGCSCPVPGEFKSSHVGTMIVTRAGDEHDDTCDRSGCADGDFFLHLNLAFQNEAGADAVKQLEQRFADWRQSLAGRPDAVRSRVEFDQPPGANGRVRMVIRVRDWRGDAATFPLQSIDISHAAGSAGVSAIGPVRKIGTGKYESWLDPNAPSGFDQFRVEVNDGRRPVILMPAPRLRYPLLGIPFAGFIAGSVLALLLTGTGIRAIALKVKG